MEINRVLKIFLLSSSNLTAGISFWNKVVNIAGQSCKHRTWQWESKHWWKCERVFWKFWKKTIWIGNSGSCVTILCLNTTGTAVTYVPDWNSVHLHCHARCFKRSLSKNLEIKSLLCWRLVEEHGINLECRRHGRRACVWW